MIPASECSPGADTHADVGHRQHAVVDVAVREGAAAVRVEREDVVCGRQPVDGAVDRPDIGVGRQQVRVVYHVRVITVRHRGTGAQDVGDEYTRHLRSRPAYNRSVSAILAACKITSAATVKTLDRSVRQGQIQEYRFGGT